jgi:hypothetical protein
VSGGISAPRARRSSSRASRTAVRHTAARRRAGSQVGRPGCLAPPRPPGRRPGARSASQPGGRLAGRIGTPVFPRWASASRAPGCQLSITARPTIALNGRWDLRRCDQPGVNYRSPSHGPKLSAGCQQRFHTPPRTAPLCLAMESP